MWRRCLSFVKNELYIALGKRKRYLRVTNDLKEFSEQYVRMFRQNRYRGISPDIRTNEELIDYVRQQNFNAYIVGSDQVWRPMYSPNLMTYFLDFVKNDNSVKKIAYAASFGVDNWEFSEDQTLEAAQLAPQFDLITVRESSGIDLVAKYLKCHASHVLDPTLLLKRDDYLKLIENPTCGLINPDGQLFCYVLDDAPILSEAVKSCESSTGFKSYFCNYSTPIGKIKSKKNKDECVVPPVEQWLKSFDEAKMVVTDSFHGVVFSIIFNKPFWVVSNHSRGAARFTSLLRLFSLENRIVSDPSKIDWEMPIDWKSINILHDRLKEASLSILDTQLKQ